MARPNYTGDPYRELGVAADASDATIKRRWRELARDHHPDRAETPRDAADLTRRMARINAAYDLLRDPERRDGYDAASGRRPRARTRGFGGGNGNGTANGDPFRAGEAPETPGGPPRPRPTRPVTGRFDTTEVFHRRNATTTRGDLQYAGQRPVSARDRNGSKEPLRASQPTGPVERRGTRRRHSAPTLADARAARLEFGKFRGHTLGEVERFEPTYIDWIARTITRDRQLVQAARVIQADMDERGVERRYRPSSPGWGVRAEDVAAAAEVRTAARDARPAEAAEA